MPRVLELNVEDPRGELEHRAADEPDEREPLDRLRRARTGGNTNSFGMTDHSFASSSGTVTMPIVTCSPWVNA